MTAPHRITPHRMNIRSTRNLAALAALALVLPPLAAGPGASFAAAQAAQPDKTKAERQADREAWLKQAQATKRGLDASIARAEQLQAALTKLPAPPPAPAQKPLTQVAANNAAPAARPAGPAARPGAPAAKAPVCQGELMAQALGRVSAVPDILRVSFRAEAREDSPAAALDAASSSAQALLKAVTDAGVAKRDMSTTDVSLAPVYDHSERAEGEAPRIVAWRASSTLRVTLRDIAKFGSLASAATEAGANGISGIQFDVSDAEAKLEEARDKAVKAALAQAKALAASAGRRLGPLLELSVNDQGGGPRPMFARAAMMESADMAIAEGEQELTANASVRMRLCEPARPPKAQ